MNLKLFFVFSHQNVYNYYKYSITKAGQVVTNTFNSLSRV